MEEHPTSSRRGGAVLLVVMAVIIVVLVVLLMHERSDDDDSSPVSVTKTVTTPKRQPKPVDTGSTAEILSQINLNSPERNSKTAGVGQIVRSKGKLVLAMVAQNVPPSGSQDSYAIWLTGFGGVLPKRLGFIAPVGSNKRLSALVELPKKLDQYDKLLVTRETSAQPNTPGTVILSGKLST